MRLELLAKRSTPVPRAPISAAPLIPAATTATASAGITTRNSDGVNSMASRGLALTPDLLNKGIAHPIQTMAEAHQHVGGKQFVDNRPLAGVSIRATQAKIASASPPSCSTFCRSRSAAELRMVAATTGRS